MKENGKTIKKCGKKTSEKGNSILKVKIVI